MSAWSDPVTFAASWRRAVETTPDASFLGFETPSGDVAEWSYGAFDDIVDRVAGRLAGMGVGPGDAVHMALANSPTFVAVWLAAGRIGAWIIPSDPMGKTPELEGHISRTRPVVGLCAVERAEVYHAASGRLPVIEIDESDVTLDVFGNERLGSPADVALTDRAAVMFTSGTTGLPKGVEITQANYAFAGKTMAEAAGLTPEDRQFVVLPLFHANAQYYSFASAIWVGASVALAPTFSASRFLLQAARHEVTAASLFAAPIRMVLARGGPVEGLRLRHCWFAQNISDDQYATVVEWFGCRPRQLYGMTETIPAVLTDEVDDPDPASMGRVTGGCVVDVQDAAGRSVEPGEVGEVVVGGEPGLTLFAGYLDAPDITEASFRNGWFLTGDRATRDATGRHFFDGRRSDVLKVAGENVSVVEVEAALSDHPRVLEAAVVGRPDPIRDEVPVAYVVPAPDAALPDVEDLMVWCEDRLGKAKRPREIILIDELPRTSVGKIRKFLLENREAVG
jgi:crotonobetaine/carnitine-CoA ligase